MEKFDKLYLREETFHNQVHMTNIMKRHSLLSLVISGDVTIDCNIAILPEQNGSEQNWNTENHAQFFAQRGGVLMLTDLIRAIVRHKIIDGKRIIGQIVCPQDSKYKSNENVHRFFAKWLQYVMKNEKSAQPENKIWRVGEFLGFQKGRKEIVEFSSAKDLEEAQIVILDDANLGFRHQKDMRFWTKSLENSNASPWVLIKMCSPVAKGNLWDYLHEKHAEKLIVVLTIDDLRLTNVQISRELSWELTAQDLVRELIYNPSVNALSHCAYAIVLFGTEGAVLLEQPKSDSGRQGNYIMPKSYLFFDPKFIEGMWQQNHPGGMIGYKTCIASAIALSLIENYDSPNVKQAVKNGLLTMRQLHLKGYGRKSPKTAEIKLSFPTDLIADFLVKLDGKDKTFAECEIRPPVLASNSNTQETPEEFWTILSDCYIEGLQGVASRIVLEGTEKVLNTVPLGIFGDLTTVDRREIESFRSIRTLVSEYVKAGTNKPLSIAVFGAPGSGKSFGISQMADSLMPGKIKKLSFNLSQFNLPDDLWMALHQVRDVSLTEKIPLVFWDEFDTTFERNKLGWLRYFLAPMQDGEFQDGQIIHPIGQAIFVFAGGTAETMKEFYENKMDDSERKNSKLPDFISRLKGFVNILGPNSSSSIEDQNDHKDNFYIIRRAILLRSILWRNTPQFFDHEKKLRIDDGVLRALLNTSKYKHGVRSMESVIAMSLTKGKRIFERSSLPSEAQLDIHVDTNDFMALVNQIDFSGENLEKLARKVHGIYEKIYNFKEQYDSLGDHKKDLNKDFAKDIIKKLGKCNCLVVVARGIHQKFKFTDEEIEMLAKIEHARWLEEKIKNGFQYASDNQIEGASKINPDFKFNKSMLFWDKLTDEEFERLSPVVKDAIGKEELPSKTKEVTKNLIKNIPEILAAVGYTIVRK